MANSEGGSSHFNCINLQGERERVNNPEGRCKGSFTKGYSISNTKEVLN